MTIRVVQWTTGRVARAAVRAVQAQPDLELVGCFAWSADKAGKDLGELVDLPATGVTATADIDEIIALAPDVVLYMPLLWDVDHMVRLLESGINVISTANFITGRSYGDTDMHRLHDAAKRGGVSLYGTGINPGQICAVALTAAAAVRQVERISIQESADVSVYQSVETWESLGFGSPPDSSAAAADVVKARQLVFQDAVEMMADALGITLDEVSYTSEFGLAKEDIDLGWMKLPKGTVCGLRGAWQGIVGGKPVLEIGLTWRLGSPMEPDWPVADGHTIEIDGVSRVRIVHHVDHTADPDDNDAMSDTANPAVNAIAAVVAAPPGLVTVAELPLITAGSVAR